MIECFNRSGVLDEAARFFDHPPAARQMRHGTQNILPPILEWKILKQRFKSRLVFDVYDVFQGLDLLLRQFHPIDDAAEEINATEIDLKALDTKPLQRFNRHEQDLDVRTFTCATVMLDANLCEFTLPSAFWLFESQHFARVVEPDGLRRGCQPRRDGLCEQRGKFRP